MMDPFSNIQMMLFTSDDHQGILPSKKERMEDTLWPVNIRERKTRSTRKLMPPSIEEIYSAGLIASFNIIFLP